jgi:hypothetical protein
VLSAFAPQYGGEAKRVHECRQRERSPEDGRIARNCHGIHYFKFYAESSLLADFSVMADGMAGTFAAIVTAGTIL